ncbi:MAG: NrpR regulatory domain-containing protein [Methanotrichaceae archaeon]|nr:NrpR regulatory domain-containing protein [Methanotrichaceae archaeon]
MKLLAKAQSSQRRLIEILRVIDEADKPIGARTISDSLSDRGYDLGERAVRYNLKILDELGFTEKQGYSGRVLTQLGFRELENALINDRIGFINTRIEEFMFRASFDPDTSTGKVVVNTSLLDKADFEKAADVLLNVFNAGYSVSKRIFIVDENEELPSFEVPAGCLAIATLCSITLDSMLMKRGIPITTSYAGIVEIRERLPRKFTDLIAYTGSSLDPMKIFMARKMTAVIDAVYAGQGKVLTNIREIPMTSIDLARTLLDTAKASGLEGLIGIGLPGEPVLCCPVGAGKIGIAICAGVNGAVAAEEQGMRIKTTPISTLVEYSKMRELT